MQSIYNIAEICSQHGIKEVILSPGSRCAPLTLAFARHPKIRTRTISDERSAAFIAMGIALQTQNTVILVCTSGSAAYNYAPAVAEAFYQHIPLLILTADRPPEWVDQLDGQTIRQENIYGAHVKASFSMPVDLSHPDAKWHSERIVSEAINIAQVKSCGPVHINIPLREPFYPTDSNPVKYNKDVKVIKSVSSQNQLSEADWKILVHEFSQSKKPLLVAGQSIYNENFIQQIEAVSLNLKIPVITDIISNLHPAKGSIKNHDLILSDMNSSHIQELQPELLISFGDSVISKSLKVFLRKFKSKYHWHIQPGAIAPDTFQSLSRVIQFDDPSIFLNELSKRTKSSSDNYYNGWKQRESSCEDKTQKFFPAENTFSEFEAINTIINNLPDNSILHLANSMPVRYANYIGIKEEKKIQVCCNRGTSGIDGTLSTAVGAALSTEKIVTVITGDMAFFYDRNALWNNYIPTNLRIVILNNHGGGIFRIIDGPGKLPELDEYFETEQPLTAENTAKDHNLEYHFCKKRKEMEEILPFFFNISKTSVILEIETDSKTNTELFKRFKKYIQDEK
ncbi:MAG TPA: 2-succinyl-5-enolpyruvyl-6-hydroxy-3-cyclohexene-1-carboxylic-acid synthase [Cytophagaceae bacterium]|nr:2-succinyl-5-enolpyruvyl-6-hydroxy-3-cyclohexene-1-carboxylic-acid synthase [Cytophagaceae bacterium]